MFNTEFMIRADNRPFEKRPNTFYGICMDIASYPFISTMVDGLMSGIMVSNPIVSRPIVSIDSFHIRCGILPDKLMKRLAVNAINHLQSGITATLSSTYNNSLVALVAMTKAFSLTTYESLVNLNYTLEQIRCSVSHSSPYPVAEIPGGLVGYPDSSLDLISGDTLLGLNHQIHGGKPLPQGKVGIVKDSYRSNGELIAT